MLPSQYGNGFVPVGFIGVMCTEVPEQILNLLNNHFSYWVYCILLCREVNDKVKGFT